MSPVWENFLSGKFSGRRFSFAWAGLYAGPDGADGIAIELLRYKKCPGAGDKMPAILLYMQDKNREPDDNALIDGIRAGHNARETAWRFITLEWGGRILGTVMQRTNCNEGQAKEAFSRASTGVDKRLRHAEPDFLQKASLKTYLTQAAIFAAWAILKKTPKTEALDDAELLAMEDMESGARTGNCAETMDLALQGIGPRCKKILLLFNDGYSMEEIALDSGFLNADVARREKHKCQERFKTYLRDNDAVKTLLLENCYG